MIGPPREAEPYPFARLDAGRKRAAEEGLDVIDFGIGDPQDPTPPFIRQALINAIGETSSYPKAVGLPQLQLTISEWIAHRFAVLVGPNAIMATLGSKEIIHDLVAYVLDVERDTVLVPTPAYPVYERGAHFHGARVVELPLLEGNDYLPDLDAIEPEVWQRTALLWLNYPNNPTGATAPLSLYIRAAELAREYGFVIASDEAYTEIWFDETPASILQVGDLHNVVAINTLSKRSCMTGYRSGFIAGDEDLIKRIRAYRSSTGTTPQEFVQMASVSAWSDETHVESQRQACKAKRDLFVELFECAGLKAHSPATFFVWVTVPAGSTSEHFAEQLVDLGIIVTPGTVFGTAGQGYVRLALVPTVERCRLAADRLRPFLATLTSKDSDDD